MATKNASKTAKPAPKEAAPDLPNLGDIVLYLDGETQRPMIVTGLLDAIPANPEEPDSAEVPAGFTGQVFGDGTARHHIERTTFGDEPGQCARKE